jgi:hypothetical protein
MTASYAHASIKHGHFRSKSRSGAKDRLSPKVLRSFHQRRHEPSPPRPETETRGWYLILLHLVLSTSTGIAVYRFYRLSLACRCFGHRPPAINERDQQCKHHGPPSIMRGALAISFAGAVLSGAFAATVKYPDACAKTANQTFSSPADALSCYKSFPFNATLRDNGAPLLCCEVIRLLNLYSSYFGGISCLRLLHVRGLLLQHAFTVSREHGEHPRRTIPDEQGKI